MRSRSLGQTPPGSPGASPPTVGSPTQRLLGRSPRSQVPQDNSPAVLLRVTPIPDQDVLTVTPADSADAEEPRRGQTPDEGVACCDSEESSNQVGLLPFLKVLEYLNTHS